MLASLRSFYQRSPLTAILCAALAVRLIAVFMAPGYLMHDDHFLTIEPSSSWADGKNFNHWLPGIGNQNAHPEPISFFYLGFLFLMFKGLQALGIDDPQTQMVAIRLIHALYSLLTIALAYRITLLISTQKLAQRVGWLLAFLAILPNFSVRNLVELVCMPPLLYGMYLILRYAGLQSTHRFGIEWRAPSPSVPATQWTKILIAAFVMGLAVGVRYQTGLFVAVVGCVLWLQRNFLHALIFGVVSLLAFTLTQADDIFLWGGEPFQHLKGYFAYNQKNAGNYPGSPFAYFSFIGYFILPPVSLFLASGFISAWKRYAMIVLPTLAFLIFHMVYPNKQERFILPALPFVIIAGVVGWDMLTQQWSWWKNRPGIERWSWRFFWTMNTVLMLTFCTTYSKKARVESMSFLHEQGDLRNFALEATTSEGAAMMPQFYTDRWTSYYSWNKYIDPESVIRNMPSNERSSADALQPYYVPNYFLFYNDSLLEERAANIRKYFPSLTHVATIEPGWFDRLLHRLNDKNTLEKVHIYRVQKPEEATPDGLERLF
ncbi:MAG: hypothetical protein ACKOZY_01995 [Flavobacteriales bacterium]